MSENINSGKFGDKRNNSNMHPVLGGVIVVRGFGFFSSPLIVTDLLPVFLAAKNTLDLM